MHVRVHNDVNSSVAAGGIEGTSRLSQGHTPLSGEYMSRALRLPLPSRGDDSFLASSSDPQLATAHTLRETLGSEIAMAQTPAMAVWDNSHRVMMQRSLVADASADTHQNRLQGYSDATVHISATSRTGGFASASPVESKHSDAAVSMPVSQTAAGAIHCLPGAIQQQMSGPFSLNFSSVQLQASPLLQKHMTTGLHAGSYAGSMLPEMLCIDPVKSSSDATVSAQSCTQLPVKGQDVAVDRTMPSIWDLDM